MKREFKPEMTVVRFGAEDVIATSGTRTMSVSGFADSTAKNGTFSFGSYTYVNDGTQTRGTLYNEMGNYFGANVTGTTSLNRPGLSSSNIATVLNSDDNGSSKSYNGTYYWDSSLNGFMRQ